MDEVKLDTDQGNHTHDKKNLNQVARNMSKRTTASFNERQEIQAPIMPLSTPPSFSFSNPFRRLNSNE